MELSQCLLLSEHFTPLLNWALASNEISTYSPVTQSEMCKNKYWSLGKTSTTIETATHVFQKSQMTSRPLNISGNILSFSFKHFSFSFAL